MTFAFRLFSISVLGNGDYSTMVETRYDGQTHALSLDFNHSQLERILVGADPCLAAFVRAELSKDAKSPRTIELDGYVSFTVRARLGSLETGSTNEQFVPLIAQEILDVTSTPPGVEWRAIMDRQQEAGLKPIREWEDDVLDQALLGSEDRKKEKPPSLVFSPSSTTRQPTSERPLPMPTPETLRPAMIDTSGPFDTLERWEQHLKDLQAQPGDTIGRQQDIELARQQIAQRRRGN